MGNVTIPHSQLVMYALDIHTPVVFPVWHYMIKRYRATTSFIGCFLPHLQSFLLCKLLITRITPHDNHKRLRI